MNKITNKQLEKIRKYTARKHKVNTTIKSHLDMPRLIVNRSNKYNYAQIVDLTWKVIASSSDKVITGGTKSERAKKVWLDIAKKAKEKWVEKIAFDRNGYLFHWRIKELADWAREWGLMF